MAIASASSPRTSHPLERTSLEDSLSLFMPPLARCMPSVACTEPAPAPHRLGAILVRSSAPHLGPSSPGWPMPPGHTSMGARAPISRAWHPQHDGRPVRPRPGHSPPSLDPGSPLLGFVFAKTAAPLFAVCVSTNFRVARHRSRFPDRPVAFPRPVGRDFVANRSRKFTAPNLLRGRVGCETRPKPVANCGQPNVSSTLA